MRRTFPRDADSEDTGTRAMPHVPPPAEAARSTPRSLRRFVRYFAIIAVLPSILDGLVLVWQSAESQIQSRQDETRRLAAAAAENMGNHLKTMIASAEVLAQLPIDKANFSSFYAVAKGFSQRVGYQVTLADADGRQFLATRLPWGATPPRRHIKPKHVRGWLCLTHYPACTIVSVRTWPGATLQAKLTGRHASRCAAPAVRATPTRGASTLACTTATHAGALVGEACLGRSEGARDLQESQGCVMRISHHNKSIALQCTACGSATLSRIGGCMRAVCILRSTCATAPPS